MGKTPNSSSRLRHDVQAIRKAIAADAAALKGEEKASGHVVMNWVQNQKKYVSRLKSQMELLWVSGGFPEMKGGE